MGHCILTQICSSKRALLCEQHERGGEDKKAQTKSPTLSSGALKEHLNFKNLFLLLCQTWGVRESNQDICTLD